MTIFIAYVWICNENIAHSALLKKGFKTKLSEKSWSQTLELYMASLNGESTGIVYVK